MLTKVLIFTDSLSSIYLFLDRSPSRYLFIVFDIQRIIHELSAVARTPRTSEVGLYMRVQFVPGHKGILGNVLADEAAKSDHGHVQLQRAQAPLEFFFQQQSYSTLHSGPSGIFLPGTELLQSPFRTEFSMGSRSRRYRRSLRRCRDP